MHSNTISVTPLPLGTTEDKIRQILHAFSVKNVHIDFPTAYVQFRDEGDLENLDIQFDNYEIAELKNAKIDKVQFNWNSIKKENTSSDKKSDSNSSDKHQDLMAADLDHLVIVQNCDQLFLKNLTEETIRQLFKNFHSVNRILKRKSDVIVEFTDAGEMEQLQNRFPGFNISELGWNSTIQKAEPNKITASEFVQEWSKLHTKESMITQATTQLGYGEKPSSGELPRQNKIEGSFESKPSSQQFLHQDIIPPFDKKTSMEVNFLNEQSKLGYKEQKPEPIHEATSHQQLDYTTEIKIENDEEENRFAIGYEAAEKQRLAELQMRKQEEERQQKERKEEQERRKKQEEERERIRKEQEQKEVQRREQQQRERKQKQQQQRLRRQQEDRQRREQEQRQERIRKEQQEKQLRLKKEQEQARRKQEEQAKRKQEQQRARLAQVQAQKRRQTQLLDKQLKQKLQAQRLKYQKEQEEKRQQQKLGYHEPPTQSENVVKEAEFIKEAGKSIEEQIGYVVNKAKEESENLVNAGLDILRAGQTKQEEKIGYNSSTAEESFQAKKEEGNLGYDKPQVKDKKTEDLGFDKKPQQVGFDLLNSSMQFLKGSYNKIQQTISTVAKEVSEPSELGYEKWTVKPDVQVQKPVVGKQPRVLKTLVTITLLIWVIFLLMQDTSQVSEVVTHEKEIGLPTVEASQQEVPVSSNENM